MGYKCKKYQKDLHQQAYEKLNSMQAFGQSKRKAKINGTAKDKIFSYKTYYVYWENIKRFIEYLHHNHPDCKTLKQARKFVNEWLQSRVDQGLSAWTIQTEAKALGKLFGITPDSPDYFKPPKRLRSDIVRSRGERVRDKHFSKANNDFLIRFCKGIGARREGISKLKGKDLRTKEQIKDDVQRLESIAKTRRLSQAERTTLRVSKDALLFTKSNFFVFLTEKGGRQRLSPIVGPDVDAIVARFKETSPEEKVWHHVNSNADIHGYRSDYANRVYKMYARPIDDIPYDRIHNGTGHKYQSEVYHCRKDERGKALDRRAMRMASISLGHSRIDVVGSHYLREI